MKKYVFFNLMENSYYTEFKTSLKDKHIIATFYIKYPYKKTGSSSFHVGSLKSNFPILR